ncbi:hypothetical protein T10_7966 [Trichinella papuae]|uniref:Uncharacterized protein n=1 Tax=Trichinella papuae TaxID=268474 RepID=A0A0V1MCX2_9BILA|nr:hypothetical protein T10_7966 [Trichinella papuae]
MRTKVEWHQAVHPVGLLHEDMAVVCQGTVDERILNPVSWRRWPQTLHWPGAVHVSDQGCLEVAAEPLDNAIGLWVIGGNRDVLATEHFFECGPRVRAELLTFASGHVAGNAETRDPVGQAGHLVNLSMAVRKYLKPSDCGSGPMMSRWTCSNQCAGLSPPVDVSVYARPHVSGRHDTLSCADARPEGRRLRDLVQVRVYALGPGHIGCDRVVRCRRKERVDVLRKGVCYHVDATANVAYVV